MPHDFPTVMGHYAPPARLTPKARIALLVLLCLPLLALCVLFDAVYYLIVRLR